MIYTKKIIIKKLSIKYERRTKDECMGRFGGGWNYILGIRLGGGTIILNCLFFTIRFDLKK